MAEVPMTPSNSGEKMCGVFSGGTASCRPDAVRRLGSKDPAWFSPKSISSEDVSIRSRAICRLNTRRASEELPSVTLGEEPLMVVLRTERKLKSMPSLKASRHDGVHIPPQARAQLHKLHEELKLRKGLDDGSGAVLPDLSDEAIEDAWGEGDSWHVFSEQPAVPRERAFNVRPFQVWPKSLASSGETFLHEHGVGAVNAKGSKGAWDTSRGQDACSVSHLSTGWEVLCVMDGHGPDGDWPSARAVRTLPYVLQAIPSCATMLRHGKVDSALHHAFDKVQEDLVTESLNQDIDLQVAGCTALCIVQHEAHSSVWVATAGDTRAVLLVQGQGALVETVDHKPKLDGERQRLESKGSEVVRIEHQDGFVEERVNIAGEDFPGLCMSRSLGDLAMKDHGVIADPEVVEWNLESLEREQAFILAASDGVWEFLPTERVAEVVLGSLAQGASCLEACRELLLKAQETWKTVEDEYCDDVTVLLVPVARKPRKARRQLCTDCSCVAGLATYLAPRRRGSAGVAGRRKTILPGAAGAAGSGAAAKGSVPPSASCPKW